jgi:hypothetical protein
VIFFHRYRGHPAEETEAPGLEPPPLPKEEKREPADTVIHIDDAQYCLLTRALRPTAAADLKDVPVASPGLDASAVAGGISQPVPADPGTVASEQPPGTPIV